MAEKKISKEIQLFPEGHEKAGQPTGLVVFTFPDETTETFEAAKVPGWLDGITGIAFHLLCHGASQKIGDSYSGAAEEVDPVAFAKTQVKETIAQLYAGNWRVGGGGGPRVNELATAVSRAMGMPLEEAVEMVGAMSDDEKKVFRKKPKIAAAIAQITAEKAIERAKKLAEAAAKEDAPKAA